MRRRVLILGSVCTSVAGMPIVVLGQRAPRTPRIGVLWHAGSAREEARHIDAFVVGLREVGYIEGQNIVIEHRFANELPERFERMAAELAAMPVDLLIGVGNSAAPYVRKATSTIPVVFNLVTDPVGTGLVDSISRPSGNVTGHANFAAELIPKRLQILKEMLPGVERVALLVYAKAPNSRLYLRIAEAAAPGIGIRLQEFAVRAPEELDSLFEAMTKAGMQAVFTNADGFSFTHRARIAELALAHRLPLAAWSRVTAQAGALVSYGSEPTASWRRVAVYVDRILKGAKPSDLPVEQATHFQMVINFKVAKALGIEVPPMLLARADEVIE